MENKPSVGRIVHYVGREIDHEQKILRPICRAAIVTAVGTDNRVSLCVFGPKTFMFVENVLWSQPFENGPGIEPVTWHWPERV